MAKNVETMYKDQPEAIEQYEPNEEYEQTELETETLDEMKTGSELLVDSLVHEDVDFIFGYPGGAVLPLYDTFWKNPTYFGTT